MKLFNRLQEKLLQRDLKKNKTVGELVEKYPVSLLVEKCVLKRYKDTAFYCVYTKSGVVQDLQCPNGYNNLYTVSGEEIGEEVFGSRVYLTKDRCNPSQYMIVAGHAEFGNTLDTKSYAIYDKSGECIVPHGCYQEVFITDNYTILSLSERKEGRSYVFRKSSDQDEQYQKILGNTICPHALIVGDDKIVPTRYSTIFPANKLSYVKEYEPNTAWIAQDDYKNSKSIKIDKRLLIKETYPLPLYINKGRISYDEDAKVVYYFTEGNNPKRVNLRNGEEIDLFTLKKIEKNKETMSMKTSSSQMTESIIYSDDHVVL